MKDRLYLALVLGLCFVFMGGCSAFKSEPEDTEPRPIPPIDILVPTETQTAAFALG